MKPPALPADEIERQNEVDDFDVIGTGPAPVLHELARLASAICGTQFAAITFIDRGRQWLLAEHNLGIEETSRDESVCGHAILTHEYFEVPDTEADERFAGNPVLASRSIRFYGGSQLTTRAGHNLGMVCVMDSRPQRLDGRARQALEQLSATVMTLLERRRTARPFEWLGHVVDSVRDEIFIIDASTLRYLHANGSALRGIGYILEDLRHMTPMDVTPSLTAQQFNSILQQLHDGTTQVVHEGIRRRADGGTYPVEFRWQLLSAVGRTVIVSIVHDITERKAVERMKDEFVSVVNHELRTPLTSIHGAIKMLQQGLGGALPPQAVRLVDAASQGSDRLRRIVDDILDIERIASGRLAYDIEAVDAADALRQAASASEPAARLAGVALRVAAPQSLPLLADPARLQQMLANLLANAIRYSPAGQEVALEAAPAQGMVRLSVRDAGPGIPEEFREHIFQRFAQARMGDSKSSAGSGLGLSIVKEMAAQMGGAAGFESRPGRTVFHIDLPVAR